MQIKWLKGNEDLREAFEIRDQVFVKEQHVPKEMELDELDKQCDHIILYSNGEPVATGRIVIEGNKHFLGRIATLKKLRGKGFGKIMVEAMINKLFTEGVKEVYIHAQISAQGFYEKIGFKAYGDRFYEAGIEHINMSITNSNI